MSWDDVLQIDSL